MKRILLVEDSRFLRAMSERSLTRAGYSVVTAADGEEAVRVALERAPDLVLLDMLLPKLSGPDVLRFLRNNPSTVAIPVVVLSSLPQSNEARLKKEGATAYFDKSKLRLQQSSDSLVQLVRKVLGEESTKEGTAASAESGLFPVPER
jgi:two-component system, OmpR family, phosphate regulon response regulator PhoB